MGAIRRALRRHGEKEPLILDTLTLPPPQMNPAPGIPAEWDLPQLVTPGQLMEWLELTGGELDWFADMHGRERRRPPGALRHYRYRWIAKPAGGGRMIEAPKARLKSIQRRVLHDLLDRIVPHDAAHAFRPGRSIAGFVAPHAGQRVVLHVDLRNFFPSIAASRVHALFRTVGYPEAVARILTGLCTNSAPDEAVPTHCESFSAEQRQELDRLYGSPHLPQGSPTSPAIANLCAHRLDARLCGLARKTNARYTRYADDLVFSGDEELARMLPRFRVWVCAIALDEGFAIRHRKTRVMLRNGRQEVSGVIVNERPNVSRADYDRIKAILTNCRRHGPASQNREASPRFREHLLGRIAYVGMLNPSRGERLRELFDRIEWDERTANGEPRTV
ncbi:MAG: reverse transcriptase family protein [Planctomycetales bacterium]